MVLLQTASGKQAHINNCREAVYGYDQRVEVLGSSGDARPGPAPEHRLR